MNKLISKNRLLKLAAHLDTVPDERFNYSTWVGDNWQGKPDLSCGTTACALGFATTIPSFRKAGLCIKYRGMKSSTIDDLKIYGANQSGKFGAYVSMKNVEPIDGNQDRNIHSFKTAEKFFGITQRQARYLFSPGATYFSNKHGYWEDGLQDDATAKDVAKLIRDFVSQEL